MINLLPSSLKNSYRAGRLNRHLVHWIVACLLGIAGIVLVTTVGYLYLDKTTQEYVNQTANTHKQLTAQNIKGVQNEIKDISNNLNLVVTVLSKQVLFSELLGRLSKLLPAETRLSTLTISQTQGAIDISAFATNYASASQLQVNLSDPNNQLFSKADIVGINCNAGITNYPCTVTIRALFTPNSPYMFANTQKTGARP